MLLFCFVVFPSLLFSTVSFHLVWAVFFLTLLPFIIIFVRNNDFDYLYIKLLIWLGVTFEVWHIENDNSSVHIVSTMCHIQIYVTIISVQLENIIAEYDEEDEEWVISKITNEPQNFQNNHLNNNNECIASGSEVIS